MRELKRFIIGITGASGAIHAKMINDWLLRFDEISVFGRKGTPKSFICGKFEM